MLELRDVSLRRGPRLLFANADLTLHSGQRVGVTGANGTVRIPIRPKRAGIIKLEIKNTKACNTQRIGVVAVFEPPVTG